MVKIVITGPESCGKTTLAKALTESLNSTYVPEMARPFLAYLNRPYQEGDLKPLALAQHNEEWRIASNQSGVLVCDTDALTILIWSREKFGRCDPLIEGLMSEADRGTHYLLCAPDIPWEPDPLRENPNDRERLFEHYESYLKMNNIPFTVVSGTHSERLEKAQKAIASLAID